MRALAVTLLLACSPRPAAKEPAASPTPHCFRATIRVGKHDQAAMACWMTAATCAKAQQKAAAAGGLMGLKEVGQCQNAR